VAEFGNEMYIFGQFLYDEVGLDSDSSFVLYCVGFIFYNCNVFVDIF